MGTWTPLQLTVNGNAARRLADAHLSLDLSLEMKLPLWRLAPCRSIHPRTD